MRVLEQLHSSKSTGALTRTLRSWAMIIGCSETEAKEFVLYLKKYDLAGVEYGDDITIACRRMENNSLQKDKAASRQRKHRSIPKEESKIKKEEVRTKKEKEPTVSPSVERRSNMLKKLRKAYHPNRAGLQPSHQLQELTRIMIDVSKKEASVNKGGVEKALFDKIIDYVERLKDTENWDEEGKYIQGLGNFLKSRSWELGLPKANIKKITTAETNTLWGTK